MKKFLKPDALVFIFFLIFLPLFIGNLGDYGLADYDEAWYAEIARNIIATKQPYLLSFNGAPYIDHPYLGFLLMAFSMGILGMSEFAARLPSAILGFSTLFIVYLIGKNLFNRGVGLSAAMILLSCVWFLFRARTGNLDAVFLFFFVTSFYLAIRVEKLKKTDVISTVFLLLFGASLGAVLTVKSLIGFLAFIPMVLYFLISGRRFKTREIVLIAISAGLVVVPWLIVAYRTYGLNFLRVMIGIGTRQNYRVMPNFLELGASQTMNYLHWGIRKWYYPGLISLAASLALMFKNRKLVPIVVTTLLFLIAFLTNSKTEIWHLIPLYPFLALIIAVFLWKISQLFRIPIALTTLFVIVFSLVQIYKFRTEIRLTDTGLNSWAFIASAARDRSEKLFLDGPDLWPTIVYYSQKKVNLVVNQEPTANSLVKILSFGPRPFLLITERWRLNSDAIEPGKYKLIAERDGKVLILADNLQ